MYYVFILILLFGISISPALADQFILDPNYKVEKFVSGLNQPVNMEFVGDDILILEKQTGNVRLVKDGQLQNDPVIHVDVNNQFEQGLLGITSTDSFVYLYFTEAEEHEGSAIANRIYKYHWDGNSLSDGKLISELPANPEKFEHVGGILVTNNEGQIFAIIGEAGKDGPLQNNPLSIDSENYDDSGVILILDEKSLKPSNSANPLDQYYAMGIRNSYGLDIDPFTGNLWDTENGPTYYDEINFVEPKFNSGWKQVMGPLEKTDHKNPPDFHDFKYSDPEFSWEIPVSPTGLTFVDSKYFSNYHGNLFVSSFNAGIIYNFKLNDERNGFNFSSPHLKDLILDEGEPSNEIVFGTGFSGSTDIEFGPDGFLYVVSMFDGTIYRILPVDNTTTQQNLIPDWYKTIVSWWNSNRIDDKTFLLNITFLIENNSIELLEFSKEENILNDTLSHLKSISNSWAKNEISDETYLKNIHYFASKKIIEISKNSLNCYLAPYVGIDYSNCDLSERNFSNLNLARSNFQNSKLIDTNFQNTMLFSSNFSNSELTGANFQESSLQESTFNNSVLKGANFNRSDLTNANLNKVNLSNANLSNAQLFNAKLRDSILEDSSFENSRMKRIDFTNSNLKKANLFNSFIRNADLTNVDLTEADLSNAHLHHTQFEGANLSGTNFTDADLSHAKIIGVDFSKSINTNCVGCP